MNEHQILIVDDDNQNLQLLYTYLSLIDTGYSIVKTNRSKKALKLAKSRQPDLIITDWEMPALNGLELLEELKKDEETKDIPVIMLTGIMLASENLKLAFDAGAVDFISKPVRKNELSARVTSVLQLSDSYKEIKKLNDEKDKFLSIIMDDFSGPFNDLLSITQKLNDGMKNYSQKEVESTVKQLKKSAEQNSKILRKLPGWSENEK